MRLHLIRTVTLRLTYHGSTFLIDPEFRPQHAPLLCRQIKKSVG